MESPPLSRAHNELITGLRRLREHRSWSAQNLADHLGWSQSKVSKIETGRTKRPSIEDIELWARACDADDETVQSLAALGDAVGHELRPWTSSRGTLEARNKEVGAKEAAGNLLRSFQPALVPGLLQTADYARRVFVMLDKSDEEVAAGVAARMERQTALYDPSKRFEFLLTEGALRWRPGAASLMAAQLDRIASVATLPNVEVSVLSFAQEAPALYLHGFTIFNASEDPEVLAEVLAGELPPPGPGEIETYHDLFGRMWGAASTGEDAVAFIRSLMREVI